jgi:hypothetical protein
MLCLIRSGYHPVILFTQNHSSYSNAIGNLFRNPMPLAKLLLIIKKKDYAIKIYKKEGIIKGGSKQMVIGNYQKVRLNYIDYMKFNNILEGY